MIKHSEILDGMQSKVCKCQPPPNLDNVYAFTQTLNSRYLGKKTSTEQYDLTHELLPKIYTAAGCKNISMVAELTKNADIHYHGTFTYPGYNLMKVIYILKNVMRKYKEFGFAMYKVVDDEEGWVDYLGKEIEQTQEMLGRRPIICNAGGYWSKDYFYEYGIIIS